MAVPHLKLLTALAVGGTAGVVALATMTSSPASFTPAGESAPAASPSASTVTQPSPCPVGTVDTPDACVKVVDVTPPPAPPAPPAPAAPAPATVEATHESEPAHASEAPHTESPEPEHQDSSEPEHDGSQSESDG
jgi:hypothetical protein